MATRERIKADSVAIESSGNGHNHGDLHWHQTELRRHKSGKFLLLDYSGAAMSRQSPRWISKEDATKWIAENVTDGITGYGYSAEQIEMILDGKDPGKGYEGRE